MQPHKIVSRDQWIAARKALLAKEKELTSRPRPAKRRAPRAALGQGREALRVRHAGGQRDARRSCSPARASCIVYHFMLGPDWEEGCPSCSYLADHFDGAVVHLAHRDVDLRRGLARAASRDRKPSSSAWAGASSGCRHSAATSISTTTCRSAGETGQRRGQLQLREAASRQRRDARRERVLSRMRQRRRLPHLFGLCARARHPGRHLQLARPRAEGPRRGRPALDHGLGAASRSYMRTTKAESRAAARSASLLPDPSIHEGAGP